MDSSRSPSVPLPDEPFVWRDLTWHERAPAAVVEPLREGRPCGETLRIPLGPGTRLGVRPLPSEEPRAGIWCSGFAHAFFDERGEPRFRGVPCPKGNRIERGQQCGLCLHLDRFRPIHRVHRGAELTEAVRAYVGLPHWLYVATFPDGSSKVGTAHERSKTSRLDQQAVARASYVALARDGVVVRRLEDALGAELALPQAKRVATKFRAWCSPLEAGELDRIHEELAGRARALLGEPERSLAGPEDEYSVEEGRWAPSEAMGSAYAALRTQDPEPLTAADPFGTGRPGGKPDGAPFGFLLTGGTGPFLTGRLEEGPGPALLASAAGLKNRACVGVEEIGREAGSQRSLF